MTWIKICGITCYEDAMDAVRLGADALGFNFYRGSPRYIAPSMAKTVIEALPKHVLKVGIFVDEVDEGVEKIQQECGLDLLQFHGDEPPSYCKKFTGRFLKVIRVEKAADLLPLPRYLELQPEDGRFLLDTRKEGQPGGTGVPFDWELALQAKPLGKLILSGGLNPENIKIALVKVQPFGVDIASGVEKDPKRFPGRKDRELLRGLITKVRRWDKKIVEKK